MCKNVLGLISSFIERQENKSLSHLKIFILLFCNSVAIYCVYKHFQFNWLLVLQQESTNLVRCSGALNIYSVWIYCSWITTVLWDFIARLDTNDAHTLMIVIVNRRINKTRSRSKLTCIYVIFTAAILKSLLRKLSLTNILMDFSTGFSDLYKRRHFVKTSLRCNISSAQITTLM